MLAKQGRLKTVHLGIYYSTEEPAPPAPAAAPTAPAAPAASAPTPAQAAPPTSTNLRAERFQGGGISQAEQGGSCVIFAHDLGRRTLFVEEGIKPALLDGYEGHRSHKGEDEHCDYLTETAKSGARTHATHTHA